MANCRKCGSDDFTPAGKCRVCKKRHNDAYKAKKAAGGSALKTKKSKKAGAAVTAALKLEVPAGFGFTASVTDDGFLQMQQANSDGDLTDTVVLTKGEARRLFQEFAGWAGA